MQTALPGKLQPHLQSSANCKYCAFLPHYDKEKVVKPILKSLTSRTAVLFRNILITFFSLWVPLSALSMSPVSFSGTPVSCASIAPATICTCIRFSQIVDYKRIARWTFILVAGQRLKGSSPDTASWQQGLLSWQKCFCLGLLTYQRYPVNNGSPRRWQSLLPLMFLKAQS